MTGAPLRCLACDGLLYRGSNLSQPEEIWDYSRQRWVSYAQGALATANARWIETAQAEALKRDNPAAEHFLYYDMPPWAQPYRSLPRPKPVPGKRHFAIFENDGAIFRMPADRQVLIVDEVLQNGRWVLYAGDRRKPALYGDFVRFDEVDD